VTGAGPVGLLAALFGVQRHLEVHVLDRHDSGPKPDLVRALGATYHAGNLPELQRDFDVIVEGTGSPAVVAGISEHTSPDGITCLLGVSNAGDRKIVDVGEINARIVLGN